jgi:hypothetical protein
LLNNAVTIQDDKTFEEVNMFTQKIQNRWPILLIAALALACWPTMRALAVPPVRPERTNEARNDQYSTDAAWNGYASDNASQVHKGRLDGLTFTGKSSDPSDPSKQLDETIDFQSGELHSAAFDTYGFGEAPYKTKISKGMTTFKCVETTKLNGHTNQLKWNGTIKDKALNATAMLITDGKQMGTSTIQATLNTGTMSKSK